jgi:hypothetical protein
VVDYENSNFATQVQLFFNYLHESHDPRFEEYLAFLAHPASYFDRKTKKENGGDESLHGLSLGSIKTQFIQLIRFHKLLHKTCNHVSEFLASIGYFSP